MLGNPLQMHVASADIEVFAYESSQRARRYSTVPCVRLRRRHETVNTSIFRPPVRA